MVNEWMHEWMNEWMNEQLMLGAMVDKKDMSKQWEADWVEYFTIFLHVVIVVVNCLSSCSTKQKFCQENKEETIPLGIGKVTTLTQKKKKHYILITSFSVVLVSVQPIVWLLVSLDYEGSLYTSVSWKFQCLV